MNLHQGFGHFADQTVYYSEAQPERAIFIYLFISLKSKLLQ